VDPEELRLIDLNLVESVRELARWQDGPELREGSGVTTICGDGFLINTALRTDPRLPAEAFLQQVSAFFAARALAFTLWIRDPVDRDLEELVRARGLTPLAETPWMVLRKPLAEARLARGVELLRISDPEEIAELAEVEAEAYTDLGFAAEECRALFGAPRRLLAPHLLVYLARAEGEAAAAALALLSHGVAGIYWVGTRKRFRRHGLAEACTRAAGNDALARGARFVALHASPMGEPLYRRMGYQPVASHRWYWIAPAGERSRRRTSSDTPRSGSARSRGA